jgi:hypothetical protein
MRIRNKSLAELKIKLPRGSAEMIQSRLKKRGILFTKAYIYQCLNPVQVSYNVTIIDEAILLGEELTKSMIEKEDRVTNLIKVIE